MKIPSINKQKPYGISVKFKQTDGWSNEYTYKSNEPIAPDSLVVVPNKKTIASVARVKSCTENFEFDPKINYKEVICVLPITFKQAKELS